MELATRLRRVRVCCGDWSRVATPSVISCLGVCGILLDPPYQLEGRAKVYSHEDNDNVLIDVARWAVENGDNPQLRIALCAYSGIEDMFPDDWECYEWKANGGYGTTVSVNRYKERIFFSPHCKKPQTQLNLFS